MNDRSQLSRYPTTRNHHNPRNSDFKHEEDRRGVKNHRLEAAAQVLHTSSRVVSGTRHFPSMPSGGDRVATMIGGSFLSVLPRGLFNFAVEGRACGDNPLSMVVCDDGDGCSRKRRRDLVGGSRTPTLISPVNGFLCGDVRDPDETSDTADRPRKRFRGQNKRIDLIPVSLPITEPPKKPKKKQTGDLLNRLPEDVLSHCLSFLGSTKDRFALQTTCKLFKDISNSDSMLANVDVGGDMETGKGGIIQEHNSPATAAASLAPFARAGNLQALYMYVISTWILY